jgi:hypothetical protein
MIYVLRSLAGTRLKLGFASDLGARLRQHKSSAGDYIFVGASVGGLLQEQHLHALLRKILNTGSRREWYRTGDDSGRSRIVEAVARSISAGRLGELLPLLESEAVTAEYERALNYERALAEPKPAPEPRRRVKIADFKSRAEFQMALMSKHGFGMIDAGVMAAAAWASVHKDQIQRPTIFFGFPIP